MQSIDELKPVFPAGSSVVGMKFSEYMNWASASSTSSRKLIERLCLPSIQRGFVWKAAQIANLWDSLLRGMPIGSLLINKLSEEDYITGIATSVRKSEKAGANALGLLDGQQRTLAMLLGWPLGKDKDKDKHIWVDLGENGKNGVPFELRISSKTQPFGFARHTHQRMPLSDRRDAQTDWQERSDDFDIGKASIAEDYAKNKIKPWKGKTGTDSTAFLFPLHDLWTDYYRSHRNANSSNLFDPSSATEPLKRLDMLFKAFKRLEDTEIPLVLMPKLRSESEALENPGEDPLIVLFERISSGGTRLSPGELLFSMIKTDCPEAHDLVENIHKTKVKHLLSATDLVLTAFRLADFESQPSVSPKIDTPDPGPSDFHRRYKGAAKNKLLEYLNDGSIENAFNTLYDIVIYDPERNPNGYPQLMMPFLSRPLIQTLIFWIMKNQAAGKTNPDLQTSMGDIAAFFLHWHLCAFDRNTASKACFKIIDTAPLGLFPAKALYHELVTADESKGKYASMWVMPSPDDIKVKLDVTRSERLRSVSERFRGSSFEQQEINVLEKFWWGKGFLLWIQRDYLSREFINHDALAGKEDEESVPYDYDHLCPQYEWRADFRNITRNSPNLSEPCRNSLGELWRRAHTGDSIGNFHILAASDNRSVGKESFPEKMKLLTQHNWQYADGALPIENIHLWNKTAGENGVSHCWTDDRVKDFQEAVDRRFLYLYSLYYNASKVII